MVAPYSGAMFAMVARSVTPSRAAPSPWYSTNFPTTFAWRSICVSRRTRSVAVTTSQVGAGRAIGHAEPCSALAVVLDELPYHLRLAEHLRQPQDQVGRGDALAERSAEGHADHVGRQEVHRLGAP